VTRQPSISIQRSFLLNAIINVGNTLKKVRIDPFRINADAIIAKARKKSNFTKPLPKAEEGLRRLVHSVNTEGKPNTFGAIAVKTLLEKSLYQRYMVERELARNPEIEKQEIKEPVFIIGTASILIAPNP
jgi:hypothetical protein